LPLPEEEAEPIFSHYFHGLAFIAKSDVYYNFDQLARNAFIFSLFGALQRYGGWNGAQEEIDGRLHEAFSPIVPGRESRELRFKSLTVQGNPAETSLANLRTAKQVADLYLIQVANRTWRRVLDGRNKPAHTLYDLQEQFVRDQEYDPKLYYPEGLYWKPDPIFPPGVKISVTGHFGVRFWIACFQWLRITSETSAWTFNLRFSLPLDI